MRSPSVALLVGLTVAHRSAAAQEAPSIATFGCPDAVRSTLVSSERARRALGGLSLEVRCATGDTRIIVRAGASRECVGHMRTPGRAAPPPYDLLEDPFIPAIARAVRSGSRDPSIRCTPITRVVPAVQRDASAQDMDASVSPADVELVTDASVPIDRIEVATIEDVPPDASVDVTSAQDAPVQDLSPPTAVAPAAQDHGVQVAVYAQGTWIHAYRAALFGVGFDIGWQLPFFERRFGVRVGGAFEHGETSFAPLGSVQQPSPSGFVALNVLFKTEHTRTNLCVGARGGYGWLVPSPSDQAERHDSLDGFWAGPMSRLDFAWNVRSIVFATAFVEAGFVPAEASVVGVVFSRPLYVPPEAPCRAQCRMIGWSGLWISYGIGIALAL